MSKCCRSPSLNIVAYTGGLMSVPGWGPVAIDLDGIDASAEQVSILADHDSRLSGIIGHGKAIFASGKLLIQGTITPSTEASRQIVDLARGRFRFQASVGLSPTNYERVRPNETVEVNGRLVKAPASGFTLVKAGVLREVSIVAIGADANTSVTVAATNAKENIIFISETITPTVEQMRADAVEESNRITAIRKTCSGRFGEIEARAISEGWDAQRTELEVCEPQGQLPHRFTLHRCRPRAQFLRLRSSGTCNAST